MSEETSASALFPRLELEDGSEVNELRRAQLATARFAERVLAWNKATNERVKRTETEAAQALSIATDIKNAIQADRADRRKLFAAIGIFFGAMTTIAEVGGMLWFNMQAEKRERARDERELQIAVERARSYAPPASPRNGAP